MPKIYIKEKDLTGSSSLPSAEHAVYIPGLASESVAPILFKTKKEWELAKESADCKYDKTSLSFRLANYLINSLGMSVVYEGISGNVGSSLAKTVWDSLASNKDKLPVRFLTTGGDFNPEDQNMLECAAKRGDCTALINLNELAQPSSTPTFYRLLTVEPANWGDGTGYYEKIAEYGAYVDGEFDTSAYVDTSVTPFKAHTYWIEVDSNYYCLGEKPDDWGENINTYLEKAESYSPIESATEFIPNTYYEGVTAFSYDIQSIRDRFHSFVVDNDYGKYAAGFTPYFITKELDLCAEGNTQETIPAVFGYLFAYARMVQNLPEWVATAGVDNGKIPELYKACHEYSETDGWELYNTTNNEAYLDTVLNEGYPAINPIMEQYPFGTIIWGARTLKPINTDASGEKADLKATHWLNVRNLISSLKKLLRKTAKRFTFNQNSDVLWYSFKMLIEPTLESMKTGNGIAGYLIEKLPTTAKARLTAKITIIPIEPVEDFDLTIELTDSINVNE